MGKLFLDFDNTIVNATKSFCSSYNTIYRHNSKFVPADWTKVHKYNFGCQCKLLNGSPDVLEIFETDMFFNRLDFFDPNTYEVLKELSEKYQIIVVTLGTLLNLSKKAIWLRNKLPFIKDHILLNNDNVEMNKSIVQMQGSYFIDDVSSNLYSTNAEYKFLFGKDDFEWNRDWIGDKLANWTEVGNRLL